MPERTEYAPGTFSWVDFMTTDLDAATSFYGELLGWEYRAEDTPNGPYVMALRDGKPVAGLGNQSDDEKQMGIPPHWNSWVSVASADDSAAKAAELGGTVLAGPMDAMDYGRMAVIAAPGGEVFGVWEPKKHLGAGLVNEHGAFGWNELATRDLDTAKAFYSGLFGWNMETGPSPSATGEYTSITNADRMNGGALTMNDNWPAEVPAYWGVYFYVDDLQAALTATKDLGGNIIMPQMDIPEVGKLAVIQDPTGGAVTLMEPANRDQID